MKHELFENNLKVFDSNITFESIYEKDYIPHEYLSDIKNANFLIIPNENFRDEGDVLFPETTIEFFEHVKETACDSVVADIAISDEDFQRIELHSAAIEVATIIIESAIFDITVSIIASFLYDLVKKHHRDPDSTSAKVKIISQETKRKKSKMIVYEGPVEGIKETLEQVGKDIFTEVQNNDDK